MLLSVQRVDRMSENIIDRLKSKEDEMEAHLAEARRKAASIREDAVKRAAAIRGAGAGDIEAEAAKMRAEAAKEVDAATKRLKGEGRAEAERVRSEGAGRIEDAVALVERLIAEGIDDREDDKGPDNRT